MSGESPSWPSTGNEHLRVDVSDDGAVVTCSITRPKARNAISEKVSAGLRDTIRAITDSDVRTVVIRGDGGTFCSGGDLEGMVDVEMAMDYRSHFSGLAELAPRLRDIDAITIAAVEGYCLAGGLGIATSCDVVLAADDATFGTPEVNVGLFPMQAMAPIMRSASTKKGFKMLFTGELIGAETAEDIGIVSETVAASSFDEALNDLVETFATISPVAIEMGKRAFYAQSEMDYDRAFEYLRECIALIAMSEDASEGIAAFQEDRDPEWSGR